MDEPGKIRGEPFAEEARHQRATLADAIVSRMDDIEQRWLARVREEVAARRSDVAPTDLKNAIREYLLGLADALRGEETLEEGGTAAWVEVAREHALTRVRLGFDIDQLVREFILLRRVLFEIAREEKLISNDLQSERLVDLIGAAIATSVRSYVESRDAAARRMQAEHIGFLTHELRNPLSAATLAAKRLRNRPDTVAAEQSALDVIDRGLDRMRSLIDGILLTQRMDAHEIDPHPVDLTLDKIVSDATRAADLEAKNKGIAFTAVYDPEIVVHVDPGLTESALQNIVDNAVKFTDHGRVQLIAEARDSDVLLHVYDNCDGVSAEELETIFEPFKRGHQGKAGTGLGLAIARRAIEAQRGQIGVESSGERGCHFWLTLPRPPH
jgi:signal transduction histidine kinase